MNSSKNPQESSSASVVARQIHTEFSGPLPHPSVLAEYEGIQQGFAERIVALAEEEAAHRRKLEEKALDADLEAQRQIADADVEAHRQTSAEIRLGQIFAFSIGVITILSGAYTAICGAELAGGLIGTGGVVALVSVFIYGRKAPHRE